MSALISLLTFVLLVLLVYLALTGLVAVLRSQFGTWGKAYQQLAKRYAARVVYSFGKPKLEFDYAGTACTLKNTTSRVRENRRTQLIVRWHDRKFRLLISSFGQPVSIRKSWKMRPVTLDEATVDESFRVYSNQPELARRMLTPATRWQVRQLIQHHGNSGVEIQVNHGQLTISKPGYIIQFRPLDDFVRFGLELFDQFKLAYNHDIRFVSDNAAVVVADVKCPICSEVIRQEMVVCVRCKTPHCVDCWEYNGQCATYACHETRYVATGRQSAGVRES